MKYTTLGQSGIEVSEICLGSMTWGTQNTLEEGHAQIDMALDHGVNFIDTAELYPVNPVSAKTRGLTESIIGEWIAKTGRRNDIVIATKIVGTGSGVVPGGPEISGARIKEAFDESLQRLKTDVIDLYQFHWPNRGSYHFRQNWKYDPSRQNRSEVMDHMNEALEALQGLVQAGKLRAFGLSNETAWGTSQWLRLAQDKGLPRVESIQNEYSLLCRMYDLDLGELSHHEQVTLLAYTPLAAGLLTGKYDGDVTPEGSRRALNPDLHGRITPNSMAAVTRYLDVARKHGLDPTQMAIAWTLTRPFPIIPIIGATSTAQLQTVLGAANISLSDEVLKDINSVYKEFPMPF